VAVVGTVPLTIIPGPGFTGSHVGFELPL